MNTVEIDRRLLRLILCSFLIVTVFPTVSEAQYKGDDIPGFLGLQSDTSAAGIYVGNVVWVYPTSTIKDNSGHAIHLPGSLTSTAEIILLNVVTNYKLFGANVGGSAGFPFIKNRIELNSLDVNTPFAYTDMFLGASLGWSLKRADIMAGYNLYIPTGRFSSGGTDNTGLGMWGNEFTIGSTVYLDPETGLWPRGYCKRNRFIDLDLAVVFDEPQFSEFVHEEIHAGTCRPDHACQSLLGNFRQDAVGLLLFS